MSMRQLKIGNSITNRDGYSFGVYLQEISKIKIPSPEEEVKLFQKIKAGDEEACTTLVEGNTRFVVSIAKQYQNQGLGLADLVNEGNLGLIKAADKFDETTGFKFISYAVWWIRQAILQALAEQGRIVRLPLNKVGFNYKVGKTYDKFIQLEEREPTTVELAEMLDVEVIEIENVMAGSQRHASLDAPTGVHDDDGSLIDYFESEPLEKDEMLHDDFGNDIRACLCVLTERQREIVCYYFGIGVEPLTLDDIGVRFDLTRERVRQIVNDALEKLRKNKSVRQKLAGYL